MPVDSIKRVPTLQVHQGNETREEKERQRQEKRKQAEKAKEVLEKEKKPELSSAAIPESSQILDSVKTVELMQHKSFEAKTLVSHAILEMTQKENAKKMSSKAANKINKSA